MGGKVSGIIVVAMTAVCARVRAGVRDLVRAGVHACVRACVRVYVRKRVSQGYSGSMAPNDHWCIPTWHILAQRALLVGCSTTGRCSRLHPPLHGAVACPPQWRHLLTRLPTVPPLLLAPRQAYGARNLHMMGILLQRALLVCVLACVPVTLLWWNAPVLLTAMHQPPAVVAIASRYLWYITPTLYMNLMTDCTRRYLMTQSVRSLTDT